MKSSKRNNHSSTKKMTDAKESAIRNTPPRNLMYDDKGTWDDSDFMERQLSCAITGIRKATVDISMSAIALPSSMSAIKVRKAGETIADLPNEIHHYLTLAEQDPVKGPRDIEDLSVYWSSFLKETVEYITQKRRLAKAIGNTGAAVHLNNALKQLALLCSDIPDSAKNIRDTFVKVLAEDKIATTIPCGEQAVQNTSTPMPRAINYAVTAEQLSAIMEKNNCKRSERTIQRWEKYLRGDLSQGTPPPDGYSLQTRTTLESVYAWVKNYAAHEKSKLNIRCAFKERTQPSWKRQCH